MTPEEVKERGSAWLNPISPEAPQGIDARYEEIHELIRQQVAAMDRPDGGEVDWPKVVTDATQLLTQTSKDITIGAHAAYGMYRSQGLDGLATGIACLAEMWTRVGTICFLRHAESGAVRTRSVGWSINSP